MADNLQFPILFDLEKGVEAAIKEWDGKYADKLEKAIQKRALNVKLKFDTTQLDSLDAVKTRLAQLKIEPITPETKSAIKELASELRTLAKALEQVQKYAKNPTKGAIDASKVQLNEQRAKAQAALAAQRAAKAEDNLAAARLKAARAANVGTSATRNANKAFAEQSSYLSRLTQRMAAYWSIRQVGNFITSIREVTAQFELQRVSLGAILQDANKGEQIFSQIKQFALSSPLSILDLTKYTKQLAAYKIEYDELFDMTKRLADISVGIGADFQRIVLAAGQTRTATYLRASELKQFTELGVPLLEELSIKLSKMNGEMVTTAEVMDLISQRAISWELVKEVLYDMTDAGGMFYDMQVKQSQTLYGLWQKLGDAASVMYAQIGETSFISSGMKEAIQMLTELMRNWKAAGITAATTILPAVAAMAAWKMATKALAKSVATATSERIAAEAKLATAMKGTDVAAQNAARSTLAKAKADEAAAIAAQKHTTAIGKLKMGLVSLGKTLAAGLGISIVIALIIELIYKISEAVTNFHKLENELGAIYTETFTLQDQSVRNFEFLADKAVKAANGSKEQKDALDELSRTYRDILPQEALTIENLARMKGNYDALTQSIKEYIAEQQRQKAESNIYDYYNPKISESQGVIRERLLKQGVSATEIGRFFVEFQKEGDEVFLSMEDKFRDAMEKAGVKSADKIKQIWDKEFAMEPLGQPGVVLWVNKKLGLNSAYNDLVNLNEAYHNQAAELEGLSEQYHDITGEYGAFAEKIKQAKEELANIPYTNPDGSAIDQSTILFQQIKDNNAMKKAAQLIREDEDLPNAIRDKEVEWNDAWIHLVESVDPDDLFDITTIDFDAMIKAVEEKYPDLANRIKMVQKEWGNVAPTNATAQQIKVRLFQITQSFGLAMDDMRKYLWDGSGDVDAYLERLKEQQDNLKKRLKEKQNALLQMGILSKWWNKLMGKDIEAEVEQMKKEISALDQQIAFTTEYTIPDDKKSNSHGGSKSDPRLQTLQEIANKMAEVNKEYDELLKKEGKTKALADTQKLFASSFKQMQATADKYGFKLPVFEVPQTIEDAQKWYKAIMDNIKRLNLKNADKVLIELGFKSDKAAIDKQQKDIEKQLKELADRISRTKTAKEFYDKVLGMTGDYDLAAKVSLSVYGDTGYDLQKQLAEQIRTYFDNENIKVEIPLDVITADNQINYKRLGDFAEQMKKQLGEEPYKAIKKIAEEGQKDLAKTYEGYLKDLEKAKTYADKRIELARTTAAKIREIEQNPQYTKEQKAELKRGYQEREDREAAKLEYDAFKGTPLYVQMFEDLEHASTSTLEMMKQRLEGLSRVWGTALDPTQLKEIQSRMNEIDTQLRERNPFKTLKESYQQYRDAVKSVSLQGAAENAGAAAKELYNRSEMYGADSAQARAAEKELKAREKIVEIARKVTVENKKGAKALDEAARIANDNLKIARGHLELAAAKEQALRDKSTYKDPNQDPKVIAAHKAVEAAKEEVDLAERVAEITTNNANTAKRLKKNFASAANQVTQYMSMVGDLAHAVADTMEALGGDEDDVQFWNDIGDAIGDLTAGFQGLIESVKSANVAGVISNAIGIIPNMVKGFVGLFSAGKVRKANKEIKSQQELLDQLEYTYGRLEKAADKVFGHEYLNNYNQQLKILQAQQQAYLKQAEAERSKGKKKDEDKIKEYENQARDTADKIMELQDDLVSQIVGTDVASAARDFANAWLDAYLSFGSTTDAIKEKFDDMIKNMIVNMVLAQVVKRALQPIFDMIDELAKDGELSTADISKVMSRVPQTMNDINNGLTVGMEGLKAAGFDISAMRDRSSEFSGIAKNVAGATSEEINNVAAIGNTLMYYVSPIPRMDENLARIRAIMENGAAATATTSAASTGWTDWQQQAMDNYTAIQRNTADTVVECRRAANACEKFAKAIVQKGATAGLNVFLKN